MTRFLLAPLAAVALLSAGCATVFTPRNCASVLSTLDSADALAKVLMDRGFQSDRAKQIADLILVGRLSAEAVCAANVEKVNEAPLPAPAAEPAAAEPLAQVVITSR